MYIETFLQSQTCISIHLQAYTHSYTLLSNRNRILLLHKLYHFLVLFSEIFLCIIIRAKPLILLSEVNVLSTDAVEMGKPKSNFSSN